MNTIGERIVVIGISGSGKSTLSRQLAELYGLHYVELDNLFWKPNWEMSTNEEFQAKIKRELAKSDRWIVDGNYLRAGASHIWQHADTLIWLDYPLRVNFWRLWKRIWGRFLHQEKLWDAQNRETLWRHFVTTDSLFLYAFQAHPDKRRKYTIVFQSDEYADYHKIHLQLPSATDKWLKNLKREKY